MNIIQDICMIKNNIDNIPKWKFITKFKQRKKLDNIISEFLKLDIFNASDIMITFLICFDEKIIQKYINESIQINNSLIKFEIKDYNNIITNIIYFPKTSHFEISNENITYSIYRNNKINTNMNAIWESLTYKIKEKYIDIIIQMTKYLK